MLLRKNPCCHSSHFTFFILLSCCLTNWSLYYSIVFIQDSPIVVFFGTPPEHEHVYRNGHICLNILGSDWSPALTVKSVCYSILSMLSSATEKSTPPGDERYSSRHGTESNPKDTSWLFDDDTV